MKRCVLGFDGGGSTTRCWLANEEGQVLGRGLAGPSTLTNVGSEGVRAALREASHAAWEAAGLAHRVAEFAHLGMAGVVTAEDAAIIERIAGELGLAAKCTVSHDILIALSGGLGGRPGVALIAGTGSACFARAGDGRTVQVGGWGSLADDVGSSYWLGHSAIREAVRQGDGRSGETGLGAAVFEYFGVQDNAALLGHFNRCELTRQEIALLAPLVVAGWSKGDAAAHALIATALHDLAELVRVASDRLGLQAPEVVLAGGLARSGVPFQPALEKEILSQCAGATVREPLLEPVAGAVLEALRGLGVEPTAVLIEQLRRNVC